MVIESSLHFSLFSGVGDKMVVLTNHKWPDDVTGGTDRRTKSDSAHQTFLGPAGGTALRGRARQRRRPNGVAQFNQVAGAGKL